MNYETFEKELADLINRHSVENVSNTPDFQIAAYLVRCLQNYDQAIKNREIWYGGHLEPARNDGPWIPD